jgi:hypothetical protein
MISIIVSPLPPHYLQEVKLNLFTKINVAIKLIITKEAYLVEIYLIFPDQLLIHLLYYCQISSLEFQLQILNHLL